MTFLDQFDPDERARFEAISTVLHLEPGAYLVRRGDLGGDIYILEHGSLDVLDNQGDKEIRIAVLDEGSLVGEVSYLDDAPRSADVRASEPSGVRRWAREDVRGLFHSEPLLAARFLEQLGRILAKRLRRVSRHSDPQRRSTTRSLHDGQGDPVSDAAATVDAVKELLLDTEVTLRDRPYDRTAITNLRTALDRLQSDTRDIFVARPDADAAMKATRRLRREMRPWLTRSALANRCMRGTGEMTVTPEAVHHVLVDVPRGEGTMGAHIDRWILDRPSLATRRAAEAASAALITHAVAGKAHRRVALLDSCATLRVQQLVELLADQSTDLTFLDPSRESVVDTLARVTPRNDSRVTVHGVQELSLRYALGRATEPLPAQDLLLLHDMLSYVPERIALPMLTDARSRLLPGGGLIAWSIEDHDDEHLLGRVLGWPTIRRSPLRFATLVERAGLRIEAEASAGPHGAVYLLRPGPR